ncbi:hypothetical protein Tco_0563537 [Tanacetum coccineum]
METIYEQICSRMDYIHTTEAELGINLDIPLSKQDPLDKLNDLANKKRKHADDIHDYFIANKRLKSSVQYKDHLAGTVLNEPVLGMIMFNSYHRKDFVTIEDIKDFSNSMLYTIQEIFFRRHQGHELDDHARTFSALLLAEVDKRNLNPLKLNDVYLLNRRLKQKVSLLKGYKARKRLLYVKMNKAISLGKVTSKVGIDVHQLSLKDCTWSLMSPTAVLLDVDTERIYICHCAILKSITLNVLWQDYKDNV